MNTTNAQAWKEWMEQGEVSEDTSLDDGFADPVSEWVKNGFFPAESFAWIAAGCFDADTAKELEGEGITPEDVSELSPEDEGSILYVASYGYKIANGDLSIEQFKAIMA
jgi:hypothetical protein